MRQPPSGRDRLFSLPFEIALVSTGAAVGLVATCAYMLGRELAPEAAQTLAFATIALAELALVFTLRSTREPAWRGPRNPTLGLSVLASTLVVIVAIYLPPIAEMLDTTPLDAPELAIAAGLALVPAALFEAGKAAHWRHLAH